MHLGPRCARRTSARCRARARAARSRVPTTLAARTTRASPQMRSATFGLRLCGIADEPFIPRANGSSTSRTSVRARWRISVAKRSSDEAQIASVASSSAWRSREITWVDTGSGSRPSRSQAMRSTSGSIAAYVPTVPESCPTRQAASARSRRAGPGRARRPSRPASSQRSSAPRGSRASARCRRCGDVPRARRTTAARARSMPLSRARRRLGSAARARCRPRRRT